MQDTVKPSAGAPVIAIEPTEPSAPRRETPPHTRTEWARADLAAVVAIVLCVGAAVWVIQGALDPRFLTRPVGNDVWFEADIPTIADTVLHRWSDQSRNARHPLFPTFATIPAHGLRTLGLSDRSTLSVLSTVFGAGWAALFYVVARGVTGRRLDALVFTALACVTSAAMFWLVVPETYALGSLSMLAALALCAWDRGEHIRAGWYVVTAAFSLSVTSSNWMAGVVMAAARWPWRRALQIAANSLCVVVVLWAMQRIVFPTANFFIGYSNESRFIMPATSGGPVAIARVLFFHSVVMPHIQIVTEPKWGQMMSVQHSSIGSSGAAGIIATGLWIPLLALGIYGVVASRVCRRFRIALAATLGGQVLMYMVYGEETFLYSLFVAPLLVLGAALATATPQRRLVLALAAALTVAAAINNASQLGAAMRFFEVARRMP